MDINAYLEGFRAGYELAVRNGIKQADANIRKTMTRGHLVNPDHIVTNVFKDPEARDGKRPVKKR